MNVRIRLSSGGYHESHITHYKYKFDNGQDGIATKQVMVDYVNKNPDTVYVSEGGYTTLVSVINASPPYLRTEPDSTGKDNLLNLPPC